MSGSRAQLAKNFQVPDFRKMVHLVVENGMFPTLDPNQPVNYYPLLAVLRHKNSAHVGKVLASYAQELWKNPLQYPDGFGCVIVNEKVAVQMGKFLNKDSGKMLSK